MNMKRLPRRLTPLLLPPIMADDGHFCYGKEHARVDYTWLDAALDSELGTIKSSHQQMGFALPKIIDIGCASGFRASEFAHNGFNVLAFDRDDRSADIAKRNKWLRKERCPEMKFHHLNLLDLKEAMFDNVSSIAAINAGLLIHFLEPFEIVWFLNFLKRISNPDTLLAFSFSNNFVGNPAPDWISARNVTKRSYLERRRDVFRGLNPDDICALLQEMGYTVLQSGASGGHTFSILARVNGCKPPCPTPLPRLDGKGRTRQNGPVSPAHSV